MEKSITGMVEERRNPTCGTRKYLSSRVERLNKEWLTLMTKIARIGPQNAAILDTEAGIIEKSPDQIMVIDEELASKLKFIKEGEFSEKEGETTLKLVGDVVPVDKIEVIRKVREHLTKAYPYSASELAAEVKKYCLLLAKVKFGKP